MTKEEKTEHARSDRVRRGMTTTPQRVLLCRDSSSGRWPRGDDDILQTCNYQWITRPLMAFPFFLGEWTFDIGYWTLWRCP